MNTTALTLETLGTTVADHPTVLVDFGAVWCAPCRQFSRIYQNAAEGHPDVVFGTVDTDAEQQLAQLMGITSVPTLMAFRGGVLVYSESGVASARGLNDLISRVGEIDADQLRQAQNG